MTVAHGLEAGLSPFGGSHLKGIMLSYTHYLAYYT